ncbi:HDOD domain-containing protein [Rheinheimera sp.]|uniref:HDOD domain-containing protein n=1 Tax=Rheinheimera sp. TaxID=1869214 RepID=UPI00307DBD39
MSFSPLEQLFVDNLIGVDPNQKKLRYSKKLAAQQEHRPMLDVERKAMEARQSDANAKSMFLDFTQAHLHDEVAQEMLQRLSSIEVISSSLFDLGPGFAPLLDALSAKAVTLNQLDPLISAIDWLTEDILRLINSPRYRSKIGSANLVKDVKTALRFLGIEALQSLVPVYAFRRCIPHSTEPFVQFKTKIWDYSLATAIAARKIAEEQGQNAFVAFCAALFQTLGHMVVIRNYLRSYKQVKLNEQKRAQDARDVELIDALEILDADAGFLSSGIEEFAAIISADLVSRWQLKRLPLAALLDQLADNTPYQSCMDLTRVLLQANCFVQVKFLLNDHKLVMDEAVRYLDQYEIHTALRKALAQTDLRKLQFE